MDINKKLVEEALKSRNNAYAPYSNFQVGAAVLTEDDEIYSGCNIENASYTPTVCAERVAIFKAVYDGHKKIKKVAIVGKLGDYTFPCGVCRQVIREFCTTDCEIIVIKNKEEYQTLKFTELFPHSFGPDSL
ncbi:cytidine deaminase [Bisgaardia hudsonensis]|uniref:Cytidine deaminase n=1 Tax=Bisgaardia hudsonensis TaxID=109472 RepID=A0A4R2N2Z5_9PAST|nr:cytidine deaminase [Bisgaardia hudsonensis]QLB12700.1 cytidine deaminase [Bisgaardia hudsonensis]TCP14248.1 cytidine deaminase [Bisgaardia hudsonensis]